MQTMTSDCPRCGKAVDFIKHPRKAKRLQGYCPCNPLGPVLEMDVPKRTRRAKSGGKK